MILCLLGNEYVGGIIILGVDLNGFVVWVGFLE